MNQHQTDTHMSHNSSQALQTLIISCFFLFLAIGLGAFGAHGLKKILTPTLLETFQTGVTYHFYHGLGLFLLGLVELSPLYLYPQQYSSKELGLRPTKYLFIFGIIFFSFNCYIYALTQIKFFALLVPIGGTSFLVGWFLLALNLIKIKRKFK